MHAVEMPSVSFPKKGKGRIVILGGWKAYVPEMEPNEDDVRQIASAFVQDYGGDPIKAREHARQMLIEEYVRGRLRALKAAIINWARRYARKYPDSITFYQGSQFILRGFDPAILQGCYFPGQYDGRRGRDGVDGLLRGMYQRVQMRE